MGDNAIHTLATDSTFSMAVKGADGRCAITGDISRLESCHLVPKDEDEWWTLKGMNALTNNLEGVSAPANCLALRADLNSVGMDGGHFVFAPYNGTAVCVFLRRELADFAVEHHLRVVTIPPRIHKMNVYARFAWGLFQAFQKVLNLLSRDESFVTIQEPDFSSVTTPSKRKRNKPATREPGSNADGGNQMQHHNQGNVEEGPQLTDDDDDGSHEEMDENPALEPPLALYSWTERDIKIAERLDANLHCRPLARYEEEAGMYPGYSKVIRLQQEYRKQHPEVSAVWRARVARVGEADDEQVL
ncbi:hypothetical protein K438DRAFT_1800529 [Mycena galopus ATCC 62051]|nr:hypothetical protein K438DRAFT_1800529 [Mycena galopus ATCC 62051]